MARPTILTPELAEDICSWVRRGARPVEAAAALGVMERTFYEWVQRGEGHHDLRPAEPLYIEFAQSIRTAEFQCRCALAVAALLSVKSTDDALKVLSRRFGGEWGEKVEINVAVRNIVDTLTNDPEEREAALAEVDRILTGRA